MDSDNPAQVPARTAGRVQIVPRVVGKLKRTAPVQVRDVAFLRAQTEKPIRITIPGPFTMTHQLYDEYYKDEVAVTMDCAAALNDEIKDLFAAGANVVQLDEPFLQARPEKARRFAIAAIDRAIEGVKGTTAVHLCFGYAARVSEKPSGYSFLPELNACKADQISIEAAQPRLDCSILAELPGKRIILGVLDLGDMNIESADAVAARVRRALPYVSADRIILAPDCGMKYLPRAIAFGKLKAMTEAAAILRRELAG